MQQFSQDKKKKGGGVTIDSISAVAELLLFTLFLDGERHYQFLKGFLKSS